PLWLLPKYTSLFWGCPWRNGIPKTRDAGLKYGWEPGQELASFPAHGFQEAFVQNLPCCRTAGQSRGNRKYHIQSQPWGRDKWGRSISLLHQAISGNQDDALFPLGLPHHRRWYPETIWGISDK